MSCMDKDLHNIEGLFREVLDDHEEAPPQQVWNAIDSDLDKRQLIGIQKKYAFIKRSTVLLLLLLGGLVVFEIKHNDVKFAVSGNTATEAIPVHPILSPNISTHDVPSGSTADIDSADIVVRAKNEQRVSELNNDSAPARYVSENKIYGRRSHSKNANGRIEIRAKIPGTGADVIAQPGNENAINENTGRLHRRNFIFTETASVRKFPSVSLRKQFGILLKERKIPGGFVKQIPKIKRRVISSPHFFISPFYSPGIAWYRLQDEPVVLPGQRLTAAEAEKKEHKEYSYSTGVHVGMNIAKHWSLQTGIAFNHTSIALEPSLLYAQPDNAGNIKYRISSSSGYGYVSPAFDANPQPGDSLFATATEHILNYAEVPLILERSFRYKKWTLTAAAGPAFNFLRSARIETFVSKGNVGEHLIADKLFGLKTMYLSGEIAVGAEYSISPRVSLRMSPVMKFACSSINRNTGIKSYPDFIGLNMGIKIRL